MEGVKGLWGEDTSADFSHLPQRMEGKGAAAPGVLS